MDLLDKLNDLAARIKLLSKDVRTEEAAKTAFVLPFIQALGYDVFNPLEVVPEHITDHGVKKGEKVDYAIRLGGVPMILIECKQVGAPLEFKHASQLFRYFTVSEAKFGVLTDGVRYLFYTDLDAVNKMDERPFLEFDILSFDEAALVELKRFVKSSFSVEAIQRSASILKSRKILLSELKSEFENPSDDLLKLLFSRVNPGGRFTAQAKESFAPLVRQALDTHFTAALNSRLQAAMVPAPAAPTEEKEGGVVTTEKEQQAFKIIQAICSEEASAADVVIRDAKSYCAILYQDNNRKPLARLYFNRESNLQVGLFSADGETKYGLNKVEDLFQYKAFILARLRAYQEKGAGFAEVTATSEAFEAYQAEEITPQPEPVAVIAVSRFKPTVLGG